MIRWKPYLLDMLGDEDAARKSAEELLTLRNALLMDNMKLVDRLSLLAQIRRLDSGSQVFLLPWLMKLVADPAHPIRHRLTEIVQELLGGAYRTLLQEIQQLVNQSGRKLGSLQAVLRNIEGIILDEKELDLDIPFADLPVLRYPVFALASLLGLNKWLLASRSTAAPVPELADFFDEEERELLLKLLNTWISKGPVFIRYILVCWMEESRLPMSLERGVLQHLLGIYETDPSALVAGKAIEAYAQTVELSDLDKAIDTISSEYATLRRRPLKWERDEPTEATRLISVSLLSSIGILAQRFSSEQKALRLLIRVISENPSQHLSLFTGQRDESEKQQIFRSAMHLLGNRVHIEIRPIIKRSGQLVGNCGFQRALLLIDPDQLISKAKDAKSFWAFGIPRTDLAQDPIEWSFQVCAPVGDDKRRDNIAYDLVRLISPKLAALNKQPGNLPGLGKLKAQFASEIDARGFWMAEACTVVAPVIEQAIISEGIKEGVEEQIDRLLSFFTHVTTAAILVKKERIRSSDNRQILRNKAIGIFLNRLVDTHIMELLFPSADELTLPEKYLLTELCKTALRSVSSNSTYRWIAWNLHILAALADREPDLTIRGRAGLILKYCTRLDPSATDVSVHRPTLPAAILQYYSDAVALVADRDIVNLYDEHGISPAQEVGGSHPNVYLLWIEVLARALWKKHHPGEQRSDDAEHAAAVCLGWEELLGRTLARLRLIDAYAQSEGPCQGNMRRLLNLLLRTSSSAELNLFLTIKRDCYPWHTEEGEVMEDKALFRRLVAMLVETENEQGMLEGRHLDQKALSDRSTRNRVILNKMAQWAAKYQASFLKDYWDVRNADLKHKATERIMQVKGNMVERRSETGAHEPSELTAVVRTISAIGENSRVNIADVLPAFVYYPRSGAEFSSLLQFQFLQPEAVDFFDLHVPYSRKCSLLQELLDEKGKIVVFSRIENILSTDSITLPSRVTVDLGAKTTRVPRRHTINVRTFGQEIQPNDPLLVKIEAIQSKELALCDKPKFKLVEESGGLTVCDLRGDDNPIASLNDLWNSKDPFLIRATVKETRVIKEGEGLLLCLMEAGFTWDDGGNRKLPAFLASESSAPAVGSEVLVRPAYLSFRSIPRPDLSYSVTSTDEERHKLMPGSILFASLRSSRNPAKGRRSWVAVMGCRSYPVPRNELTKDLRTLFYLDALDDDHPAIEFLTRKPIPMKVLEGDTLSVISAPPRWNTNDLILAIISGEVEDIIFLRLEEADGAFIFEICRTLDRPTDGRESPLAPLGEMLRLVEGDLYDQAGKPISGKDLQAGMRLSLRVSLQSDPTAPFSSFQGGSTEKSILRDKILLQLKQSPDMTNIQLRERFSKDSLVRVKVESIAPLRLTLIEQLPNGVPSPEIAVYNKKQWDRYLIEATEIDALVERDWDITDEKYVLEVVKAEEFRLQFNRAKSLSDEVLRLYELRLGSQMQGKLKTRREAGVFYVTANHIDIDTGSLLSQVLPKELLSPAAIERISAWIRVKLTRVQSFKGIRIPISTATPEVPFLQGSQSSVSGLIVSVPLKGSPSRSIGVRWVCENPEGNSSSFEVYDKEWRCEFPPNQQVFPGGLLKAVRSNTGIELSYFGRRLFGTILFEELSLEEWVEGDLTRCSAVLLRHGSSLREWMLAPVEPSTMPPRLIKVQDSLIHGKEILKEAWSLDIVTFDVMPSEDMQTAIAFKALNVIRTRKGLLHEACGKPFELEIISERNRGGYYCRLHYHNDRVLLGPIPVFISSGQLSQLKVGRKPFLERGSKIPCSIRSYELTVKTAEQGNDLNSTKSFEISIEPEVVPRVPEPETRYKAQRKHLESAMRENNGRIEGNGEVVFEQNGRLYVRMLHYIHEEPLELPEEEQTWIEHTGKLVPVEWTGKLVVFEDRERKRCIASLRRVPPISLQAWLDQTGRNRASALVELNESPLYYYGALDEGFLEQCGLESPEQRDAVIQGKMVLFEVLPGQCFVAEATHLKFMGEEFAPSALKPGDAVTRFRVFLSEDNHLGMDIHGVSLDICHQFQEFDKHKGVLFGKICMIDGEPALSEVWGPEYRSKPVSRQRLGRWKLRLENPGEHQLERLKSLDENDYVYLKFVQALQESGELIYRLLSDEEVFKARNLVYVRYLGRETLPGGTSQVIMVQPLTKADRKTQYLIPDTLFSIRRHSLERLTWELHRIILATVYPPNRLQQASIEQNTIRLSLIHNPPRNFSYFMYRSSWQGIVTSAPESGKLSLEVGEGVNVLMPLSILGNLDAFERPLQRGDVLFLESERRDRRLRVSSIIPSHLNYLDLSSEPTVLTKLWGTFKGRKKKFESNEQLNCDLIGYSQLQGVCWITSENLLQSIAPIPQIATALTNNGTWVNLSEGIGASSKIGKLFIEGTYPRLLDNEGFIHSLKWNDVTCCQGPPSVMISHISELKWYNKPPMDDLQDLPETIDRSLIIGACRNGSISLTANCESPFPVDYLIEQFPSPQNQGGVSRAFIVACTHPDRIIVEIAPGRYAELPYSLLRSAHAERMKPGMKPCWTCLARGDRIVLELVPPSRIELTQYLPGFTIRHIYPTAWPRFSTPFIAALARTEEGYPIIGPLGPSALSGDHLDYILGEVSPIEIDLMKEERASLRYTQLKKLFEQHGTGLILKGKIVWSKKLESGYRYFVELGIRIPLEAGKTGYPAFFSQNLDQIGNGAPVRVQVIRLKYGEDYRLKTIEIRHHDGVGDDQSLDRMLVKAENGQFMRMSGSPSIGDSVMVYMNEQGDIGIHGYERFRLRWISDADSLHLHRLWKSTGSLVQLLFPYPGSFIWATVERIVGNEIHLSRRVQIEQGLPHPGQVVRARIKGAIDRGRLLVNLMGLPYALDASKFAYGRLPIDDFIDDLRGGDNGNGLEIEVTTDETGALSSVAVYELPDHEEIEAKIEYVGNSGVLVNAEGCRLFVSGKELSWCHMTGSVGRRFFQLGSSLRLAVLKKANGEYKFSHIRTRDIRNEVDRLVRTGGPIYVTLEYIDERNNTAVVRGRSGVLMELKLDSATPMQQVREKTSAYLLWKDNPARRIVLTLDDTTSQTWLLPSESRPSFPDSLSPERIKAIIESLHHDTSRGGLKAVPAWIFDQKHLAPTPRTIRLILEVIAELSYTEDAIVSVWEELSADRIESAAPCLTDNDSVDSPEAHLSKSLPTNEIRFRQVWQQIPRLLTQRLDPQQAEPIACFGAGYWLVLENREEQAVALLDRAADHLHSYPDVTLTLAVACHRAQRQSRAVALLKALSTRLWTSAMSTLDLSLPYPSEDEYGQALLEKWVDALISDNVEALKDVAGQISRRNPGSPLDLAHRVWIALTEADPGKRLEILFNKFLESLRDAEWDGEELDSLYRVLAARLSFARGDLTTGWEHLEKCRPKAASVEVSVARFWHLWLVDGSTQPGDMTVDPVLNAMLPVLRSSRWRDDIANELVENLFNVFRKSLHGWRFDIPLCHVIPVLSSALRRHSFFKKAYGHDPDIEYLIDE